MIFTKRDLWKSLKAEPTATSSVGTNGYSFTEGPLSELGLNGKASLSQVEKEGRGYSEQQGDHEERSEGLNKAGLCGEEQIIRRSWNPTF